MTKLKKADTATTEEQSFRTSRIAIETIAIPEGGRPATKKAIESLAASMKAIGLLTPIMIRFQESEDADMGLRPTLVAGARRLEAAKLLGWRNIRYQEVQEGAVEAEMKAIVENLHRRLLSKKARDEHIRRFAELLEAQSDQSGQIGSFESKRKDGKGHRPKGMASTIASATGLSKKTVSRALTPASNSKNANKKRRSKGAIIRDRLRDTWAKADQKDRDWFLKWAGANVTPVQSASPNAEATITREDPKLALEDAL